jgi:hypothetical protein
MIILSGNYWTPASPAGTFTSGHLQPASAPNNSTR